MSSAHHPQTDGQTKATNRVVEMVLRCTLHGSREPSNVPEIYLLVEFVINSIPSLSTGYAPFYLNYGYYPATPLDLIQDAETTTVKGVNQFV